MHGVSGPPPGFEGVLKDAGGARQKVNENITFLLLSSSNPPSHATSQDSPEEKMGKANVGKTRALFSV